MAAVVDFNQPHFLVEVDGVSDLLRVIQFWGEEGISQLFRFSLQLESDSFDHKPLDIIGKNVKFTVNSRGEYRVIHGIVGRFEFVGPDRNVALYTLDISPAIYTLSLSHQSRIFQGQSVVEILKAVLTTAGFPSSSFKFSCNGSYQPIEYCVQYRESDLDFFNRMAERFGIFYFFEYTDSGTTLVVADSHSAHIQLPGSTDEIVFCAPDDLGDYREYIHDFKTGNSLRPGKQTVRDYNFKTPHLDLTSSSAAVNPKHIEWYDYPGQYEDQAGGKKVSQLRAEIENCMRHQGSGSSNCVRLFPSALFKLASHPVPSLNAQYVITSITHTGSQPTPDNAAMGELGYSNEFHMLPASIPFRADMSTRRPLVEGQQTATVTGPSGEEIYCDDFGRIKVRFHWDRSSSPDDKSSCWIRTSQTWAGKGWGGVYIPRIGQEVIVSFLEGDPDQPVVVGCVYNGANMPAYPLPSKRTVSSLKSNSSLGGGGYNEIRFEDLKGSEEFYLQAEKDLKILTKNDKNQSTGNNESLAIGKNRTKSVGADEQVTVSGNRTESVDKDESITIGKNRTESVGKDESISVTDNRTMSIGKDSTCDVGANANITVGKDRTESVGKKQSLTVADDMVVSVGKKYGLKVDKSMNVVVEDEIVFKCGDASISLKKNGDITIKGGKINIKGSGDVVIKGSKIAQN